jgi:hypothetical protein
MQWARDNGIGAQIIKNMQPVFSCSLILLNPIHFLGRMARYFLFVEDDSYSCLGNVLYQSALLVAMENTAAKSMPLIRTGTPMFDGFDDSSTFMSGTIALAFANHYPEKGFDCANVSNKPVELQREFDWLSWGNSWMEKNCGWRSVLRDKLNLSLVEPSIGTALVLRLTRVSFYIYRCKKNQICLLISS